MRQKPDDVYIIKKPVATNCNWFCMVLGNIQIQATTTTTDLKPGATATSGLVAVGCVQSSPSLFSGPCNWTLIHYSLLTQYQYNY